MFDYLQWPKMINFCGFSFENENIFEKNGWIDIFVIVQSFCDNFEI